MSVTIERRPFPFPGQEVRLPCRVGGSSTLTEKSLVRLVTGKNTSTSTIDGVPPGDFFTDIVVGYLAANYPFTDDSGVGSGNVQNYLGIIESTTAVGRVSQVLFRGLARGITLRGRSTTSGTALTFPQGSLIFLDAAASFALSVAGPTTVSQNSVEPGADSIIVGRLAQQFTLGANLTTAVGDIFFDGVNLVRVY